MRAPKEGTVTSHPPPRGDGADSDAPLSSSVVGRPRSARQGGCSGFPRQVARIDLAEYRAGFIAVVDLPDGSCVSIGEPTATIGGALDCARQLVLDRDRVRIGDPEVP